MQAGHDTYPQRSDGFTLVEVIVSMALMALVFTSAFGTYFLGMRMVEDSREQLRASQIIQSELEAMRTMTWDDITSIEQYAKIEPQGNFVKQFADEYEAYRWVLEWGPTDQRVVFIRVRWTNSRGEPVDQWFNTIFTQNGLNDYYYTSPS